MANVGWRTQLSFLLAGAIFVLCQMVVNGNRNAAGDPGFMLAADRSFQSGPRMLSPGPETDGRAAD